MEDDCGICDDNEQNDCIQDCSGEWGGTAEYDICGVCAGNDSSCDGVCIDDPPICNPGMYSIGTQFECENMGGTWEGYLSYWHNSCEELVAAFDGNCSMANPW